MKYKKIPSNCKLNASSTILVYNEFRPWVQLFCYSYYVNTTEITKQYFLSVSFTAVKSLEYHCDVWLRQMAVATTEVQVYRSVGMTTSSRGQSRGFLLVLHFSSTLYSHLNWRNKKFVRNWFYIYNMNNMNGIVSFRKNILDWFGVRTTAPLLLVQGLYRCDHQAVHCSGLLDVQSQN